MKSGDSFHWFKNYEIAVNGKVIGRVIGYNESTGTLTYKKYGFLRRLWGWAKMKSGELYLLGIIVIALVFIITMALVKGC